MKLIRDAGVRVIFPKHQTCCGQPAFNSGYRDEALQVARSLMQCFPRDLPIVVPSGSCAGMIKQHWPELFAGQADETAAREIANRTFELTEFLVDQLQLKLSDLGQPIQVAIHTSCSARREMGVADRIESLVAQLEQVEVLQQERKPECCGFGGTFAVNEAAVSAAMGRDRIADHLESGSDVLASADMSCLMHLEGIIRREKKPIRVMHVAQILAGRSIPSSD